MKPLRRSRRQRTRPPASGSSQNSTRSAVTPRRVQLAALAPMAAPSGTERGLRAVAAAAETAL
jgi:hypothetical protein